MAARICPPWKGYLLINPLRKLLENPNKILGQFVREGMTVLEPGCGMGYFTLPLARLVGPEGRVVAVEIQPKMLSALERRARKAGLLSRIELRQARADRLGVEDLAGEVDFAGALHLVHEVPDQSFFSPKSGRPSNLGANFSLLNLEAMFLRTSLNKAWLPRKRSVSGRRLCLEKWAAEVLF